jgi:Uma2 family endonuclease
MAPKAATVEAEATVEDLYHVPENGKAELVNGKLVLLMPTGGIPGYAGGEIFVSLRSYARQTQSGYAFPDNVGFLIHLPHRRSLSPDASLHPGPFQGGRFLSGAPVFAAEVRSENDYGATAEQDMADKRSDYFAAGTKVVWDVDVLRDEEIRKYIAGNPNSPTVFRRGDVADALPALPDWDFLVDDLFPQINP